MKKNDQIFYSDIKMLQAMKYMYNYYCDVLDSMPLYMPVLHYLFILKGQK